VIHFIKIIYIFLHDRQCGTPNAPRIQIRVKIKEIVDILFVTLAVCMHARVRQILERERKIRFRIFFFYGMTLLSLHVHSTNTLVSVIIQKVHSNPRLKEQTKNSYLILLECVGCTDRSKYNENVCVDKKDEICYEKSHLDRATHTHPNKGLCVCRPPQPLEEKVFIKPCCIEVLLARVT